SDLDALASSTSGKVEIETLEDGRDGQIIEHLLRAAVLTVFKDNVSPEHFRGVLEGFEAGTVVDAGEDVSATDYVALVNAMPSLADPVRALVGDGASPALTASAVELVLEGLHLSKRLNKDAVGSRATYR